MWSCHAEWHAGAQYVPSIGPVIDGPVIDGPVIDGPVIDGPVIDGPGRQCAPWPL